MPKDFTYTLKAFSGLEDDPAPDSGGARTMVNFEITDRGSLKKRDGFRTEAVYGGAIRALWTGELAGTTHFFAVEGVRVRHSATGWEDMELIGTLPGRERAQIFPFGSKLWFLGGAGINVFDPADGTYGEPEPYRPLVTVNTSPEGVGTPLEEANLLGGRYRQSFSPFGGARTFKLFMTRPDSVDYVKLNGEKLPAGDYSVDLDAGTVTLNAAPPDVADSVEIGFTKEDRLRSMRINQCRGACAYGSENDVAAFLWGDPDHPNVRYHSGLADGKPDLSYFPENSYTAVGDGSAITAIIRHYDRQLIFTENAAYCSYPRTYTDGLGRDRTVYPVDPLSSAFGCVSFGGAALMDNDPVTVTDSGLCRWSATSVREEKNARIFSSRIGELLSGRDMRRMRVYRRASNGRLLMTTSLGEVLVYSPRADSFWIHEGVNPYCFVEDAAGTLFFGASDGRVCRVGGSDDDGEPIRAVWTGATARMGADAAVKFASRVILETAPDTEKDVRLYWTADVTGESSPNRGEVRFDLRPRTLFGFGSWDFARLSFNTQRLRRTLAARIAVRRFTRMRMTLVCRGTSGFEATRLTVRGFVTNKRI